MFFSTKNCSNASSSMSNDLRFTGCREVLTVHHSKPCRGVERLSCHTLHCEPDLHHGLYHLLLEKQRGSPSSVQRFLHDPMLVFLPSRGSTQVSLIQHCMAECDLHVVETTKRKAQLRSSTPVLHNAMQESPRSNPCLFDSYLHCSKSGSHKVRPRFACSRLTTGPELPSQLLGASALAHTLQNLASSHVPSHDLHVRAVDPAVRH